MKRALSVFSAFVVKKSLVDETAGVSGRAGVNDLALMLTTNWNAG